MSAIVIPAAAAPQVECGLKILVSIPALSIKEHSDLAKVEEHTSLCGLTTARNNLICSSLSPVRKGSVLCLYACSVCCGQSSCIIAEGKKEELCSGLALLGLLCQNCLLEHHPLRSVSMVSQI